MFEFLRKQKKNDNYNKKLDDYVTRMQYIQSRLEKVRQLFNNETDPEKTESYIYEEKALMIRLDHLIKAAKEDGISADILLYSKNNRSDS
ncbi:MAG: DUF2508 domain-containing protein [Ruminiclostridium sp.]|nr:DUF2508 domain-containing protein [Ruminiclostridium sp.]